jgi:hypothetical protein
MRLWLIVVAAASLGSWASASAGHAFDDSTASAHSAATGVNFGAGTTQALRKGYVDGLTAPWWLVAQWRAQRCSLKPGKRRRPGDVFLV